MSHLNIEQATPEAAADGIALDEVRAVGTGDVPPASLSFGLEDVFQRVEATGDLFAFVLTDGASLPG